MIWDEDISDAVGTIMICQFGRGLRIVSGFV